MHSSEVKGDAANGGVPEATETEEMRRSQGRAVPSLETTSIPIREEFRCRRLRFCYHDIRAFTTSWLPLPVFLLYRLILLAYASAWLIAHPVIRSSDHGPKWFIFVTNWSYALLVVGFGAITLLCLLYAIAYYFSREYVFNGLPKSPEDAQLVFSQDNISWYVKVVWFLYVSGGTLAFMVTAGYWVIVYDSDEEELDVATVHVHGINLILVLIDLLVSRIPYQLLHFFYPSLIAAIYIAFTGVYFAAGGEGLNGNEHIYDSLDYGDSPGSATGYVVALFLASMLFFGALFLFGRLRDVIYKRIPFIYRDIRRPVQFDQDSSITAEPDNGSQLVVSSV